jgi:hypothetical protein
MCNAPELVPQKYPAAGQHSLPGPDAGGVRGVCPPARRHGASGPARSRPRLRLDAGGFVPPWPGCCCGGPRSGRADAGGRAARLRGHRPAILSAFVAERAGAGLAETTVRSGCGVLRVFLRYAHRHGLVATGLSRAVEWLPACRLADIPRSHLLGAGGTGAGCRRPPRSRYRRPRRIAITNTPQSHRARHHTLDFETSPRPSGPRRRRRAACSRGPRRRPGAATTSAKHASCKSGHLPALSSVKRGEITRKGASRHT